MHITVDHMQNLEISLDMCDVHLALFLRFTKFNEGMEEVRILYGKLIDEALQAADPVDLQMVTFEFLGLSPAHENVFLDTFGQYLHENMAGFIPSWGVMIHRSMAGNRELPIPNWANRHIEKIVTYPRLGKWLYPLCPTLDSRLGALVERNFVIGMPDGTVYDNCQMGVDRAHELRRLALWNILMRPVPAWIEYG